jgi:hypothetical protein
MGQLIEQIKNKHCLEPVGHPAGPAARMHLRSGV